MMNCKANMLSLGCILLAACATSTQPPESLPTQGDSGDARPTAPPLASGPDDGAKEEPTALAAHTPGEGCVSDVMEHASSVLIERIGEEADAAWLADRSQVEKIDDLDGDGVRDTRVIVFAYAYNLEAVVYLSNHGCAKMAGAWMMTSMELEESSSHGVRDLSTWTKGGCAGLSGEITRYAFDPESKTYKSTAQISCGCDESEEGRDAACPSSGAP